jgi:hypothetical protein
MNSSIMRESHWTQFEEEKHRSRSMAHCLFAKYLGFRLLLKKKSPKDHKDFPQEFLKKLNDLYLI